MSTNIRHLPLMRLFVYKLVLLNMYMTQTVDVGRDGRNRPILYGQVWHSSARHRIRRGHSKEYSAIVNREVIILYIPILLITRILPEMDLHPT